MSDFENSPARRLWRAIMAAQGDVAEAVAAVNWVAGNLRRVGMDKPAEELECAVSGLNAAMTSVRNAEADKGNADLADSQRLTFDLLKVGLKMGELEAGNRSNRNGTD